jgi:hypothetical protein
MWKRYVIVAFPFSSACCTSFLRCPSRASVSWAIVCRAWELSYCAKNVLAWICTVKLSKFDRSGSWAASAPKSTWGRTGTVGGMSCPSTMAISSASTSGPHPCSSYYWEDITSLLLILIFTLIQNNTHTNLICFTYFLHSKKFHA